MLKTNEVIELSGAEGILIIKEMAYILISLKKIAEHYYNNDQYVQSVDQQKIDYAIETTRFVDENLITRRLAKVRRIISEKFDDALGSDEMDDIERELEMLKYWERPGD